MSEGNPSIKTQSGILMVPRKNRFKIGIVKVVLFVLGKGLQSASKHDKAMQNEVASWPENTLVLFKVAPDEPRMAFAKTAGNQIVFKGARVKDEDATLIVAFKNLEAAFMMLTAQIGTAQAYTEHRMAVSGDLVLALSVIRCLNIVERYLFPTILAKHVLRRLPDIPFLKRNGLRLWIYVFGIAFGI